jgi:hypothetical protein
MPRPFSGFAKVERVYRFLAYSTFNLIVLFVTLNGVF